MGGSEREVIQQLAVEPSRETATLMGIGPLREFKEPVRVPHQP